MEGIEICAAEQLDTSQAIQISIEKAEEKSYKYLSPHEHPWRPCCFRNDEEIPWLQGFSIDSGEPWMIPAEILSQDYTIKDTLKKRPRTFVNNTNGLASGMTPTEARVSAILEAVERHSITLNHMLKGVSKRIELGYQCPNSLSAVLDELDKNNVKVYLYDATEINGLHAIVAILCSSSLAFPSVQGYGCSLNQETAILRAILEANQAATLVASGSRDDITKEMYFHIYDHTSTTKLLDNSINLSGPPIVPEFKELDVTPDEELQIITSKVQNSIKREIVIYDYTPPDHPISVCRALVPTFEGYYHPGYRQVNKMIPKLKLVHNSSDLSMPAGGRI